MLRRLPLIACALVLCALVLCAHSLAQESPSPGVAKVLVITRLDINAAVGASQNSTFSETGRGEVDGRIFVYEAYERIEIEPSSNPNGSYLFYRDIPTKVSDAKVGYSDRNHSANANQALDLPVTIVDSGEGVRLFIGDPRSTETGNAFTLYLSYTMIPTVRFGVSEVADEFQWNAIPNEWDTLIENVTIVCALHTPSNDASLAEAPSQEVFEFEARYAFGNEKLSVNARTQDSMHASGDALDADMEAADGGQRLSAWMKSKRALKPGESVRLAMTVPVGILNQTNAAVVPPGLLDGLKLPSFSGAGFGLAAFVYFCIATTLFFLTAGWVFFVKAGQPGWAAIIPIYNTYIFLVIAGKPGWWLLVYIFANIVPVAGTIAVFVLSVMHALALAQCFGKGTGFGIGLILLPFIFFPILAFGDAQYEGPEWATAPKL